VRRFADFSKKPLDRVTAEDDRTFQLHLIQDKNRIPQNRFTSTGASTCRWQAQADRTICLSA
jgi:hypothetical protein